MLDPHVILGVSPGATADVLQRAFKRAVRRHHPDLNPRDPQAAGRLRTVVAAYQHLTGFRVQRPVGNAAGPAPAPSQHATVVACQLRGADLLGILAVPRARAAEWLQVDLKALDACGVCGGAGWEQVAGSWGRVDRWECETCSGAGILRVERRGRVRVPSSAIDGARIRLRGIGLPRPGLARGDAILVVRWH